MVKRCMQLSLSVNDNFNGLEIENNQSVCIFFGLLCFVVYCKLRSRLFFYETASFNPPGLGSDQQESLDDNNEQSGE